MNIGGILDSVNDVVGEEASELDNQNEEEGAQQEEVPKPKAKRVRKQTAAQLKRRSEVTAEKKRRSEVTTEKKGVGRNSKHRPKE